MNSPADGSGLAPPIASRLVAGLYEFLLLAGLLLSAGFLLVPLRCALNPNGCLLFADDARSAEDLAPLLPLCARPCPLQTLTPPTPRCSLAA